jgi:hypothetical protein
VACTVKYPNHALISILKISRVPDSGTPHKRRISQPRLYLFLQQKSFFNIFEISPFAWGLTRAIRIRIGWYAVIAMTNGVHTAWTKGEVVQSKIFLASFIYP